MTFPDPYEESYPPSLWETEVVPSGVQATTSTPSDSWTKAAIQEWLDENEIAWDSSMTKAQLLELVHGPPASPEPPAEEPEPAPEGGEG
jgi:hypothetical protein